MVIHVVSSDSIEGTVAGTVIGRVRTDANGKYQLLYTPSSTGRYQAMAAKSDGTIIATSGLVQVNAQ